MLYIVGTPIGNLSDVTYRAVDVLKSVDYIACEDTRTSVTFLKHYKINKPLVSYHKYNEKTMLTRFVRDLRAGKNIAVISDAGMPGISDPGNILVNKLIAANLEYTVIPGPSAFLNAFVLSGYKPPFTFIGFLPDGKTEKINALKEYRTYRSTLVIYVAPHDMHETIESMSEVFGDRDCCFVREITKKFEGVYFSTLQEGYGGPLKGEFVVLVEGFVGENTFLLSQSIEKHILFYLRQGMSRDEVIKLVAKERKLKKNEVYQVMIRLERDNNFANLAHKPAAKYYTDCDGHKINLITLTEKALVEYVETALLNSSEARKNGQLNYGKYLFDAQKVVEYWIIHKHNYESEFGKSGFYRISTAGLRKIVDVICSMEVTVDVGFLAELFNENEFGLKLDSGEVDLADEIKENSSAVEINRWKQQLLKKINQLDKADKRDLFGKTISK